MLFNIALIKNFIIGSDIKVEVFPMEDDDIVEGTATAIFGPIKLEPSIK